MPPISLAPVGADRKLGLVLGGLAALAVTAGAVASSPKKETEAAGVTATVATGAALIGGIVKPTGFTGSRAAVLATGAAAVSLPMLAGVAISNNN